MGMDTAPSSSQAETPPESLLLPPTSGEPVGSQPAELREDQKRTIIIIIVVLVLLTMLTAATIWILMNKPLGEVARIRDIFIILMAIQSLIIGLALVVLMIQLARLINLMENEIKPILDTTNETVSNLRGTTIFLSENLVEPVLKMNEYLAGLTQLFMTVGLFKRSPNRKSPKGD